MTTTEKLYVGDVGIIVECETNLNCTTATAKKLKGSKPDGTAIDWTCTLKGGDTDSSILTYTTVFADLSQSGTYKLQAYVTFADGIYYGNTVSFRVFPLLDA